MSVVWWVIAVGVIVAPVAGVAQVYGFGAQKGVFYEQTKNDTEPTTAAKCTLYAFFNAALLEVNYVTVSTVDTYRLTHGGEYNNTTVSFTDLTALDRKFPVGDAYTFKAKGGKLNGESGSLPIQADAFPAVLYLTGQEVTQLKDITPDSTVTIKFAYGASGAASTELYFTIYDGSKVVYRQEIAVGATSFYIPSSDMSQLKSGFLYKAELANYNSSPVTSTGSFTAADSIVGWITTTAFGFRIH